MIGRGKSAILTYECAQARELCLDVRVPNEIRDWTTRLCQDRALDLGIAVLAEGQSLSARSGALRISRQDRVANLRILA
jgi:hypothetical protein